MDRKHPAHTKGLCADLTGVAARGDGPLTQGSLNVGTSPGGLVNTQTAGPLPWECTSSQIPDQETTFSEPLPEGPGG